MVVNAKRTPVCWGDPFLTPDKGGPLSRNCSYNCTKVNACHCRCQTDRTIALLVDTGQTHSNESLRAHGLYIHTYIIRISNVVICSCNRQPRDQLLLSPTKFTRPAFFLPYDESIRRKFQRSTKVKWKEKSKKEINSIIWYVFTSLYVSRHRERERKEKKLLERLTVRFNGILCEDPAYAFKRTHSLIFFPVVAVPR